MCALDAIQLVLKLINTLVRICELVLKLAEYGRNIQRTAEEGITQLFFHLFYLMIIYICSLHSSVTTDYDYFIIYRI